MPIMRVQRTDGILRGRNRIIKSLKTKTSLSLPMENSAGKVKVLKDDGAPCPSKYSSNGGPSVGKIYRGMAKGVVAGGVTGGAVGTTVPIVGTALGAATGALIGAAVGGLVGACQNDDDNEF